VGSEGVMAVVGGMVPVANFVGLAGMVAVAVFVGLLGMVLVANGVGLAVGSAVAEAAA